MIFCIFQILRETNYEDSWSTKSAILTHLEALIFYFLHFFKADIYQMNKLQTPWSGKNGSFGTSTILKIDFT